MSDLKWAGFALGAAAAACGAIGAALATPAAAHGSYLDRLVFARSEAETTHEHRAAGTSAAGVTPVANLVGPVPAAATPDAGTAPPAGRRS